MFPAFLFIKSSQFLHPVKTEQIILRYDFKRAGAPTRGRGGKGRGGTWNIGTPQNDRPNFFHYCILLLHDDKEDRTTLNISRFRPRSSLHQNLNLEIYCSPQIFSKRTEFCVTPPVQIPYHRRFYLWELFLSRKLTSPIFFSK